MSTFTIDFFELMFLAEACTPTRPIARSVFWIDLCDKHYHTMSAQERERAYEWLGEKLSIEYEDSRYFMARFDPSNQYVVKAAHHNKTEEIECFLFDEKYHTAKNKYVFPDYIVSVSPLKKG